MIPPAKNSPHRLDSTAWPPGLLPFFGAPCVYTLYILMYQAPLNNLFHLTDTRLHLVRGASYLFPSSSPAPSASMLIFCKFFDSSISCVQLYQTNGSPKCGHMDKYGHASLSNSATTAIIPLSCRQAHVAASGRGNVSSQREHEGYNVSSGAEVWPKSHVS